MPEIEVILGLLVAVTVLATLASRLKVPYPILLVLGGLVLGFLPGLPRVELPPDERAQGYENNQRQRASRQHHDQDPKGRGEKDDPSEEQDAARQIPQSAKTTGE